MIPSAIEFLGLSTLLLGSAIIGAALMRKIRFSPILGFILIGMAIGPFGLGVIENIELVNLLAELGIVLIFFTVGLQLSVDRFRQAGGSSVIVGLLQQAMIFFLGYIVGYLLGWSDIESLFLGAILAVTSTTISVRLLQETGVLRTRMASTIMAISIVDDLAAIFALTILANVAVAGTLSVFDILIRIGETIAFFVFTLALGLKVVPKIMTAVERLGIQEAPFLVALSLGFSLAFLAHEIGLSSAIGASLAGMTIASARKSHVVVDRILPLRDFFGTIFFLSVGMLVSVATLFNHFWVSIPIAIVAVFGKLVANYVGAFLVGHTREEASTIGTLMVPRGEFSYVIAKQGVDLNATREAIYPITIFVSFASMLVLPLLMRAMPTILDSRTIIPLRLFMFTDLMLQIVRNLMLEIQRAKVVQGLRTLIPKLMVNVAVIVAILSIISLTDQYIFTLYSTSPTLQTISYETFKLIISIASIAYPVVSIFGATEKITAILFDAVQHRIVRTPVFTGGMHYIHRIIRNVVLAVTLLLVSDFVTPSISILTGFEHLLSIMSLVTFGVFIYLIVDTLFVINRRLEKSLLSSLLSRSDVDEEDRSG